MRMININISIYRTQNILLIYIGYGGIISYVLVKNKKSLKILNININIYSFIDRHRIFRTLNLFLNKSPWSV